MNWSSSRHTRKKRYYILETFGHSTSIVSYATAKNIRDEEKKAHAVSVQCAPTIRRNRKCSCNQVRPTCSLFTFSVLFIFIILLFLISFLFFILVLCFLVHYVTIVWQWHCLVRKMWYLLKIIFANYAERMSILKIERKISVHSFLLLLLFLLFLRSFVCVHLAMPWIQNYAIDVPFHLYEIIIDVCDRVILHMWVYVYAWYPFLWQRKDTKKKTKTSTEFRMANKIVKYVCN